MAKTKTHDEFIGELNNINRNITVLDQYINRNYKIECRCNICGYEWKVSPSKLLHGRSCPICARKRVGDANRSSVESVKRKLKKVNSNVKLIGEYVTCNKPIECECLVCGFHWFPTVSNLYAGKSCPKCSKTYHRTHEEFVKEMENINPNICIVGKFINTKTKIECECKKCGYKWSSSPSSLLQGCGCAKCSGSLRIDPLNFKKDMKKKYSRSNIMVLGEYVNTNTPILCRCKKCGIVWNAKVNTLLKGTDCPQCGLKKRLKTTEYFKKEIKNINPFVEILGEYKQAHLKMDVRCKKCGFEFCVTPHSLLQGHGCPECAKRILAQSLRKSHEKFLVELNKIQPDIKVLDIYEKNNKPLKCLCNNCEHIWKTRPDSLLSGRGCPNCVGFSGTSFVEQLMYVSLITVLGKDKVLNRNKKELGIELDIYVPSLNFAIEYGSWFWHKNKIKNDKRKRTICNKKGIELITIYDSYDLKSLPFHTNCFCFKENLSEQKNYGILKKMIIRIMENYGLESRTVVDNFDNLVIYAKKLSRRRGTQKFRNELKEINPNIEVLGEFYRVHDKIECRCKKCNYSWYGTPSGLLRENGCPKCGGAYKKTHDEYIKQVKEINHNIEIVGEYKRDDIKIGCRCLICGHEWAPVAGSVLQGHGCPKCAIKRKSEKFARSHAQFIEIMRETNKGIRVLGKYINARTKIKCECLMCHSVWFAIPDSLINRGSGCPKCARLKRKKNNLIV